MKSTRGRKKVTKADRPPPAATAATPDVEGVAPDPVTPGAPSTREAVTSLVAAGIQGAYLVQKTFFGGEPVPRAALVLLDLTRAQLSLSYTLLKASQVILQQTLDTVFPAQGVKSPKDPGQGGKGQP